VRDSEGGKRRYSGGGEGVISKRERESERRGRGNDRVTAKGRQGGKKAGGSLAARAERPSSALGRTDSEACPPAPPNFFRQARGVAPIIIPRHCRAVTRIPLALSTESCVRGAQAAEIGSPAASADCAVRVSSSVGCRGRCSAALRSDALLRSADWHARAERQAEIGVAQPIDYKPPTRRFRTLSPAQGRH